MICTLWTPISGWKGMKKFIPRDSLNSPLIYILFSLTVSVISIDLPCRDANARVAKVPLKGQKLDELLSVFIILKTDYFQVWVYCMKTIDKKTCFSS